MVLNEPSAVPKFTALQRRPERIGQVLIEAGFIDRSVLRKALFRKTNSRARVGEVLSSSGLVSDDIVTDAVAMQWNIGRVDLSTAPPDPDLMQHMDVRSCLRIGCVPWRVLDGVAIVVLSDPQKAEEAVIACALPHVRVAVAVATWDEIRSAIVAEHASRLEHAARNDCPEHMSCRNWRSRDVTRTAIIATATIAVFAWLWPVVSAWAILGWILLFNALNSAVRFLSAGAILFRQRPAAPMRGHGVTILAEHRPRPRVSIMVPLHREDLVLPALIGHIKALDYPQELLDIKLLVEEDDAITRDAIAAGGFARDVDVITVPRNKLTTKPRALNYGINFCHGEIIGILDAEDRPEPDQIKKVVEYLHTAPPDVAAVQGILDFYNYRRNWMARCFAIEYSMWFRVLLRGLRHLNLPIPLGGTTVYFRRRAIEELGGWDAHNVTEDADLGIRIARFGMKTEMMPSVTWEEANCAVIPWIKQRSRWLKGYLISWCVHMRNPRGLYRDLGFWQFLSVQTTFLGGVTAYLSIPVLWLTWFSILGFGLSEFLWAPAWVWHIVFGSMIVGNVATLLCMVVATIVRGTPSLSLWIPSVIAYWFIGMFATVKAFAETLTNPFYWDKTVHGTQSDQEMRRDTSPSSPIDNDSFV